MLIVVTSQWGRLILDTGLMQWILSGCLVICSAMNVKAAIQEELECMGFEIP